MTIQPIGEYSTPDFIVTTYAFTTPHAGKLNVSAAFGSLREGEAVPTATLLAEITGQQPIRQHDEDWGHGNVSTLRANASTPFPPGTPVTIVLRRTNRNARQTEWSVRVEFLK